MTTWNSQFVARVTHATFVTSLVAATCARANAQGSESLRPDLSGRWELNAELSENATAKLEQLAQAGGHGPRRHFGGPFGGGRKAQMKQAQDMVLNAPQSLVVTQDGDRIVLTAIAGPVRTLTANARTEKVDDRDVRTTWEKHRLVSVTSLGHGKVTETFERAKGDSRLIVTTRLDVRGGSGVSVRRVYDARSPQ